MILKMDRLAIVFFMLHVYVMSDCPPPQLPNVRHSTKMFAKGKTDIVLSRKCTLLVSKNGIGAGLPRNLDYKCKYDDESKEFYQLITWDPPNPSKTPVTMYRVKIEDTANKYCFRVNTTHFKYYRASGFRYTCAFTFGIVAQPIHRDGTTSRSVYAMNECPQAAHVEPLGSVKVPLGGNWSFNCRFRVSPIPNPNITWYFSKDKRDCKNMTNVIDGQNHVHIAANKTVLTIKRVTPENVGCYAVSAHNGWGSFHTERGYIDIEPSYDTPNKKSVRSFLIRVIAGTVSTFAVMMMIVAVKLFGYSIKRPRHRNQFDLENKTKHTLYISHCMETPDEKQWLTGFASLLTLKGVNVILDMCSEVQINIAGGLARWIPCKMKEADTILVVLTQRYATVMHCDQPLCNDDNNNNNNNSSSSSDNDNINNINKKSNKNKDSKNNKIDSKSQESILKINCECNIMRNILFENVEELCELVVLCKGVTLVDLPHLFKNRKIITCSTDSSRIKDQVSQVTCLVAKRGVQSYQQSNVEE